MIQIEAYSDLTDRGCTNVPRGEDKSNITKSWTNYERLKRGVGFCANGKPFEVTPKTSKHLLGKNTVTREELGRSRERMFPKSLTSNLTSQMGPSRIRTS